MFVTLFVVFVLHVACKMNRKLQNLLVFAWRIFLYNCLNNFIQTHLGLISYELICKKLIGVFKNAMV